MGITMEIITSTSNCKKEHHRSDNNAAETNSASFTCLKPNQSPGDFPIASCALADEIAAFIGPHSPLDAGALFDTVQHWFSAAATEAVATYKLSSAAAALAAVTTLAEAAVKAATDAAAAAAEHVPHMDYSLAEAGFLLSRGERVLQYELEEGLVIGTHKGASHRISHAELQRQVLRDDGRDGQKRGKRKPPNSEKPAGSFGAKSA
jgi:hypothetical protein